MAKITAVIDIGSNSVRMMVFERTSRYGFHLLKESKSRVRISENSYQNGGVLQEAAIRRAECAIAGFVAIAKSFHARKIICVATSAVRDAPNKNEFIKRIKASSGVSVKVIDGKKESYYGGVAASNLLPITEGITIDIGGGSTELALIKNGVIEDTVSFQIGTVRLKELFFDKEPNADAARAYVRQELASLPQHFKNSRIIGIGGTLRAVAQSIIKKDEYALNIIHAYEYSLEKNSEFFESIINTTKLSRLKKLGFKQERFDVIREGLLIFTEAAAKIGASEVMTSGVGVREGVFLSDMLRSARGRFPENFNPSVKSLMDRFKIDQKSSNYANKTAQELFDLLKPLHGIDDSYKRYLAIAAKLYEIGVYVNFYKKSLHAFSIIFEGLDYGFTHKERVLISKIVRNQQKKLLARYEPASRLSRFLPEADHLRWLSFILFLATELNLDRSYPKVEVTLRGADLHIRSSDPIYLAKESLAKVKTPARGSIVFSA